MIKKRKSKTRGKVGKKRRRREENGSMTNSEINSEFVRQRKTKKVKRVLTVNSVNQKRRSKREKEAEEETVGDKKEKGVDIRTTSVNYKGSKNGSQNSKVLATKIDKSRKRMQNVRLSAEVDFLSIGICKDYQKYGYCGFGDGCIYAHIREEYKSSYDLSKEFEEEQRKKREGFENSDDEEEETKLDESVPMYCMICKKDYSNPVITSCKHLFCEDCILKEFSKNNNTKCFVCDSETNGSLVGATDIVKREKGKQNKTESETT